MSYCADVTRDIADAVVWFCVNEGYAIQGDLLGWLHKHYGIHALNEMTAEYPCLAGEA